MKPIRRERHGIQFRATNELTTILNYKSSQYGISRNAFLQQYLWNQFGDEYEKALRYEEEQTTTER